MRRTSGSTPPSPGEVELAQEGVDGAAGRPAGVALGGAAGRGREGGRGRRRTGERVEAEEEALPRGVKGEAVAVPGEVRVEVGPECRALEGVADEERDEGEVRGREGERAEVEGDELGEGRRRDDVG